MFSKKTLEEMKEMSDRDRPYYRAMRNEQGVPVVVCMQWFDEYDYDQDTFMTKEEFETKEECYIFIDKYKAGLR